MNAIDETRDYLATNKGRWRQICAESGVGYWWVLKFTQGHIRDPGVRKLEALLAHKHAAQNGDMPSS